MQAHSLRIWRCRTANRFAVARHNRGMALRTFIPLALGGGVTIAVTHVWCGDCWCYEWRCLGCGRVSYVRAEGRGTRDTPRDPAETLRTLEKIKANGWAWCSEGDAKQWPAGHA